MRMIVNNGRMFRDSIWPDSMRMASNLHVLTMHNGFAGGIFTRF